MSEADRMMRELMWCMALLVPGMCIAGGATLALLLWLLP